MAHSTDHHYFHSSDFQNLKPSLSLSEIDPNNMEILMSTPFSDFNFNPAVLSAAAVDASTFSIQVQQQYSSLLGFSQDDDNYNLISTHHDQLHDHDHDHDHDQFPAGILAAAANIFPGDLKNIRPIPDHHPPNCSSSANEHLRDEKKRKSMHSTPESSSANSSPPVSENGIIKKNSTARGKRVRISINEKSKEVVHVRARRGQATDSHSLAERVRRGKINERLRCLQDIVPGCQKTMGMAVMLDEIINYVQSLQNQVEFLSMKLTAASNLYNFNGETDTIDAIQRARAFEAMKMHKQMKEELLDGLASTQLGHFDLTFGCCPSLPFNT